MRIRSIRVVGSTAGDFGPVDLSGRDFMIFEGGYKSYRSSLLYAIVNIWHQSIMPSYDYGPMGQGISVGTWTFEFEIGAEIKTAKIENGKFTLLQGIKEVYEYLDTKHVLDNGILYYNWLNLIRRDIKGEHRCWDGCPLKSIYGLLSDAHLSLITRSIIILDGFDAYLTSIEARDVFRHLLAIHGAKGNQILVGTCRSDLKEIGKENWITCPGSGDLAKDVLEEIAASKNR